MAASNSFRRCLNVCRTFNLNSKQLYTTIPRKNAGLNKVLLIGVPCACVTVWQAWKHTRKSNLVPKVYAATESEKKRGGPNTGSYREERFQQFASVEYEGQIYMTPQDFLESITEDVPRPRIGRTRLTPPEVEAWLRATPSRKKGGKFLFRSMHNKGIISYTEYLFLLCVLTKPHSGFRIAFNMFDTDGNQIVDKKEFLVLESFFILPPHERKFVPREKHQLQALLDLENMFSKRDVSDKPPQTKDDEAKSIDPIQDTTLLIHFFGRRGNDVLNYKDFHMFMENLQSEVIELEFMEFSRGMKTISEEDFARILLRYTNLEKKEISECLDRVQSRMPEEKGITFEEFKQFCQFMNSLDDFTIAMNFYTYAMLPISQEEFQRAVKICTNFTLGSHIVTTVFNIFDVDGDGHLSYKEFISIMKDRKHRGSRASTTSQNLTGIEAFKSCVKTEMKSF